MKRILYVTTIGATMGFFTDLVQALYRHGDRVDIACGSPESLPDIYQELETDIFELQCSRSPFSAGNCATVRQLRHIVGEGNYDIVHCHTPIAAACTRLACRQLRKKMKCKVVYTAHGFHFYEGAPLLNWAIYYPVEKLCSRWTDCLITINKEDYARAIKEMHASSVKYVPGVGVDIDIFSPKRLSVQGRRNLRADLGADDDTFVMLSVGELNENKNHSMVLEAMSEADFGNRKVLYLIAGKGSQADNLIAIGDGLPANQELKLLGYRNDVADLYAAADLFVFPSIREGLPVSAMEALASGTDTLCSENRGSRDLLPSKELFYSNDSKMLAHMLSQRVAKFDSNAFLLRQNQLKRCFQKDSVISTMIELYGEITA